MAVVGGANPTKGVSFPKKNNERQRFLTKEEADKLLEALQEHSPQVARMASLALYGGLRLGEVLALKWCNVAWEAGFLHVLDSKNGDPRSVSITDPILEALAVMTAGAPR